MLLLLLLGETNYMQKQDKQVFPRYLGIQQELTKVIYRARY
jgi:hypothetical protein